MEQFGQYGFALALVAFFNVLSDFGINTYQTRETAILADNNAASSLIGQAFVARLLLGIISALIILAICFTLDKPLSLKIFLAFLSITMIINFLSGGFASTLLGYEKFRLYSLLAMGTQVLTTCLGFAALAAGSGLVGIGVAHMVTASTLAIAIGTIVYRKICKFQLHGSLENGLAILKQAAPLCITALRLTVNYRADFILLSLFKGDKAVGYYNSAYALVNGLLLVSTAFSATILPRMAGYFNTDKEKLTRLYSSAFKYLFYLGLAMAVGATMLAHPIFELIYPESYLPGAGALSILIWALAFMFVNSLQSAHLVARNQNRQLMYLTGIAAFVNITLNLILIPPYSFRGAALATIISELAAGTGYFIILRSALPFKKLVRWSLRLLPAVSAMIIAIMLTESVMVIPRAILAGMLFIFMLAISGALDLADLGYLAASLAPRRQ